MSLKILKTQQSKIPIKHCKYIRKFEKTRYLFTHGCQQSYQNVTSNHQSSCVAAGVHAMLPECHALQPEITKMPPFDQKSSHTLPDNQNPEGAHKNTSTRTRKLQKNLLSRDLLCRDLSPLRPFVFFLRTGWSRVSLGPNLVPNSTHMRTGLLRFTQRMKTQNRQKNGFLHLFCVHHCTDRDLN